MDHAVTEKVWKIWNMGQTDAQYLEMKQEMIELEKRYDAVLQQLANHQQDIICDFVSLCEGMSWRMLEIACTLMDFPNEE